LYISRIINVGAVTLQSTPLLAIAPLLSLWFGAGLGSKVAASAVICFFPLLVGWLAGAKSIDDDYMNLFDNIGATKPQRVLHLIIPSALPYFFGGLRVAASLSILGAIVGEFVGASEGLGYRILSSSYYLRTADMFAYVIVTGITGWALGEFVLLGERRVLFWRGKGRA
jgi:NitT/TauT family transport system permease protein